MLILDISVYRLYRKIGIKKAPTGAFLFRKFRQFAIK